jgi:hypothetical protein
MSCVRPCTCLARPWASVKYFQVSICRSTLSLLQLPSLWKIQQSAWFVISYRIIMHPGGGPLFISSMRRVNCTLGSRGLPGNWRWAVWTMFGLYLGHVWTMFGPCLGHVWIIFGPYLGHVWTMFGPGRLIYMLWYIASNSYYWDAAHKYLY